MRLTLSILDYRFSVSFSHWFVPIIYYSTLIIWFFWILFSPPLPKNVGFFFIRYSKATGENTSNIYTYQYMENTGVFAQTFFSYGYIILKLKFLFWENQRKKNNIFPVSLFSPLWPASFTIKCRHPFDKGYQNILREKSSTFKKFNKTTLKCMYFC